MKLNTQLPVTLIKPDKVEIQEDMIKVYKDDRLVLHCVTEIWMDNTDEIAKLVVVDR